MKKALLFLFIMLCAISINAQTVYESFQSRKLNATRDLKIRLPNNYDPESNLKYPVIIVFDGDYLFEPVVGQVAFQTYFDKMPESIVVGLLQGKERFYDSYHDEVTGLPIELGARFYEFISTELIPHIDRNYKTSKFKVAVGHDLMANFMNAFLLKEDPIFKAYVNLSPDFKGEMDDNVSSRLKWLKDDVFYYMVTSSDDVAPLRNGILDADQKLKQIDNKALKYYFDDFEGLSHYTLVTGGLSQALDKIFELYKPISDREFKEDILTYEGTLDTYISKRYKKIEDLFGISKPISEDEFEKIIKAAEQRDDVASLEKIGKLANKQDPTTSYGTYYMALHAERIGKTKRAKKLYESALDLESTPHINKDLILLKVEGLTVAGDDKESDID
ncbi:alpha/beta hydrolase [Gelidibacter maritimus]|uniref:Esterase n=1 Tax=Gelidibacter maritimus TaxID=2761487 RepID=A0A7W2M3Q9_9FLAO|nr:alpha/beta hydrolase-fold protein [Gelidibacter maritimus]MBA6152133.1 esterase [Gelidibacter maritimus]